MKKCANLFEKAEKGFVRNIFLYSFVFFRIFFSKVNNNAWMVANNNTEERNLAINLILVQLSSRQS